MIEYTDKQMRLMCFRTHVNEARSFANADCCIFTTHMPFSILSQDLPQFSP